ncbi:MAG TPA: hypothetical protein VFT66_21330 [Roseiflexaceae bacterium]|nr:hypothetical protein [Roseiflexaceae bacterium]
MRRSVRWAAMVALLVCAFIMGMPGSQAMAQAQSQRCFVETTQCISGRIRSFWESNGGLSTFGYPITDQHIETIEGKPYQVQWFERARLELHPENAAPYDVLLGRLGVDRLQQQGRDWATFPKSEPGVRNDCQYFAQTQHFVCAAFLVGWLTRGLEIDGRPGYSTAENLALLGLPLSDAHQETIEGKSFQVQWFERGRIEFHPENNPPYNILGGLLGSEIRANQQPSPVAAPTGHIMYLDRDGVTVKQINPDGSGAQTLFMVDKSQNTEVLMLGANSSGSAFVYAVADNTSGLQYTLVQNGTKTPIGMFASHPRWSPDGSMLAFQRYGDANQEGIAVLYNVATHATTELPIRGTPDWFPDGKRLVYVEHAFSSDGTSRQNVRIYDITARTSTALTNFTGTNLEAWAIQEAHVLPDGQQVIFFGGQFKNLGASGNGMQWWWIPATGGEPKAFTEPDGNGVAAYAASPNGEWIAAATQMHGSACVSDGSVLMQTTDVRGGVAAEAPLALPTPDSHVYISGLGWEPNSNYLVIGEHTYECSNAGGGPSNANDAIYVWKIRLINQNGATFVKVADGSQPVWIP